MDRTIFVDGVRLSEYQILNLAENDGLDSIDDFWAWFDRYSPFIGRIIHWTNCKY